MSQHGQQHQQMGGRPGRPGERRPLGNGAVGVFDAITKKDGTPGLRFRITGFSDRQTGIDAAAYARAARSNPRQITQAEAQKAFDKFYSRNNKIARGPRKGSPRFKSMKGVKSAKGYDLHHTNNKVVTDARYLRSPHVYDYPGVDTGSKVRKPLSAAQRANLSKGRDALTFNREAQRLGRIQAGGYWW